MFETLQGRFQDIFRRLAGRSHIDKSHVKEAMRDVKRALLEADVNVKATKEFINAVEKRAIGAEVLKGLEPAQQVIKIVKEELTGLLGGTETPLQLQPGEARIMIVGLQGSGKTTFTAKFAHKLREQGRKPFLCAGDIYRPAAIEQLKVMGEKANVPVFEMGTEEIPSNIAIQGSKQARRDGCDTIILDTAGRLHIDDEMMTEVQTIKQRWKPTHILLVVDSMVGQDAINQAQHFNDGLGISGTVLSKLDSDTRGGAAISIRHVTGQPIFFVGVGEKLEDLEPFYPDRMASRILGMGDMLSLIEKVQSEFDEQQAEELQQKLVDQTFTFDDFLNQLRQVKKLGGVSSLMSMMPGMGSMDALKQLQSSEGELRYIEAMILSMTTQERMMPGLINASRKRRIAKGSGTTMQTVNRLLKQFAQTKEMMSVMAGGGAPGKGKGRKKQKLTKKMKKKMMGMQGMLPPGGFPKM